MGLRGAGTRYSMRDFHATILQLLGLDQNRLWFLHNGRNEKLTDFGGDVIREMLGVCVGCNTLLSVRATALGTDQEATQLIEQAGFS